MRFDERIRILHVEDDAIDVEILQRVLRANGIRNPVVVAANGEEALDWLQNDPSAEEMSLIAVVDINMPRMSGLEFLQRVRATPHLRHLPVYVLTSSDQDEDIESAYQHNVAGYILKPRESGELAEVVRRLHDLWLVSEFEVGGPVRPPT
jgi:CheY-like chemotaxis protein